MVDKNGTSFLIEKITHNTSLVKKNVNLTKKILSKWKLVLSELKIKNDYYN